MSEIRKVITDCFKRMRETGESYEMCARWIAEDFSSIIIEARAAGHAAAVAKLREPSIEMLGAVAREENLDVTWEEQVKRYLRAAADALEAEKGEG